jgi:adenosyl cobinamide kinase/adenosyl cobinamide phosphate guanylyltransferase
MGYTEIANKIRKNLNNNSSYYFTVKDSNDNDVKIRVSNHSANRNNNDEKTLSFITERTQQKKSSYNQMINEWAILENGLTDTYEEIEYILENELN